MIESIRVEPIEDGIVSLQVASDEEPHFGSGFIRKLEAVVDKLRADATLRAVVVEGGQQYFSAGASHEALVEQLGHSVLPAEVAEVGRIPKSLLSINVPTVAAMAGHAIGGGFLLGLACDVVVLAEESIYGANFITLGFTPGMGSTALLEEFLGAPLARELLYTGRLVKGRELKALGVPMAYAIVPRNEVRARALVTAREITEVSYEAVLLLKRTLAARKRATLERVFLEEGMMHEAIFAREETRRRITERYARSIPETWDDDGKG